MVRPEAMESVNALDAVIEALSVTRTVKVKLPAAVGVPVMAPLEGLRFRPPGREPALMSQLYGVVPPDAVSVSE